MVVPAKQEGKGEEGGNAGYKAKVKSKYAPKRVKLHLEEASDEDAYWRGYESARLRVVLPSEDSSCDVTDSDGARKSTS